MRDPSPQTSPSRWYHGVTRYQWTVLAIASAGWIFDVFEGQLFNITRSQLLPEVLGISADHPKVKLYGDVFLGIFLLGGTAGGLIFGTMADRLGRRPTMILTILMYSVFSGLTYFAQTWWQVGVLRFLVAMGVGGEWAVAASLVAEVFPTHARAHASGIFHASSVLGTWGATVTGLVVGSEWRYAYLIGIAPALLVLWVRAGVRESESWKQAGARAARGAQIHMGSFRDLLLDPRWASRALLGMALAAVGLASFWSVTVAGQDLTQKLLEDSGVAHDLAVQRGKFAYGIIQTAGGGLGLLAFGPLCALVGRRLSFALLHIGALVIVPVTCYLPNSYTQQICLLPIFGFLTLGMHAGYAIYFPELFPTHLRATGTGFCFNVGRIVAAPMLFLSGWVKSLPGMDLRLAITLLGMVFALGLACIWFLPETKGRPLPE